MLQRDGNGNLPIYVIAAAKKLSDEESFLRKDCYENKSILVGVEFINGNANYCCEHYFECAPWESIRKSFHIRPGAQHY